MSERLRVVWAHDHRFISAGGSVFSEVQFESYIWDRYLAYFREVCVVGRKGTMPADKSAKDLFLSSRNGVVFDLQPNISSPNGLIWSTGQVTRALRDQIEGADAVIARLPSEIGLLAVAQAKRLGKPYAIEVVGCAWDGLMSFGSALAKLYAPVQFQRVRNAVRNAPFVTYVTQQFLQQRYPASTTHQAAVSDVELGNFDTAVVKRRFDRIDSISDRPIQIGLIGSLSTKVKGIQHVLPALPAICSEQSAIQFRVLGGGDRTPWQALAAKYGVSDIVQFEGTLPGGDPILEWLDSIDIYLQPSLKEGLPRALVEAMSRACPAIGSRVAGIPELLDDTWLVPKAQPQALAERLKVLIRSKELMKAQAERNWNVAQEFTPHALAKRREEFWAEFASHALKSKIMAYQS